jgi:molybdopterin synthase sulfur carrier subunit
MAPEVLVALPQALRGRAGNQAQVMVKGETVREIIDGLELAYPGMRFSLCYETGELRPFVNIFVNRAHIRYLRGLDTPIEAGTQISIMQSVAGG